MSTNDRKIKSFTVHYSDGTVEEVSSGLLAFMSDAESMMVKNGSLDKATFLMLLAGLEEIAESYLEED